MIDTIVFKIHNLEKHVALVNYLHQKHVHGSSVYSKEIPIDDVAKKVYNSEYWIDWSNGRKIEKAYRSHLPSHHYNVAYCISFDKNYIEFNFSVPKLLYRTNVFQFVPHYFDSDYHPGSVNSIPDVGKASYKRLKRFINWFFETNFNGQVDWSDVQITRVDLAFNKLFRTKEQALDYLKDLRRIRKKHSRETKLFTDGKWLGLYFVTADYTFKVYHKGAEFAVHDKNELRQQGLAKDKLEVIQDFADRMIRYEVEFRTGMMSKLWVNKCFRRKSPKWNKARRYYYQYSRNRWIKKDGVKLYRHPPMEDKDGNKYSKEEIEAMKMSKAQMALVNYGKFFTNKTFQFFLDAESHLGKDSEAWDAEVLSGDFTYEQQQRFDSKLWGKMVNTFVIFYREFSVQYQEDVRYVIEKIRDLGGDELQKSNEFREFLRTRTTLPEEILRRVGLRKIQVFMALLKEKTFDEIKKSGIIPLRNFYNYKKVFMELGYTDVAPRHIVPQGENSFAEYFFWLEDVNRSLHFRELFKSKF